MTSLRYKGQTHRDVRVLPALRRRVLAFFAAVLGTSCACDVSTTDAGPAACVWGDARAYLDISDDFMGSYSAVGVATVVSNAPSGVLNYSELVLMFADGTSVSVQYDIGVGRSLPLSPGAAVYADVEGERPFWHEASVVLRDVDAGGPGALLAAVWYGLRVTLDPELEIALIYDDCVSDAACGPITTATWTVTSASGASVMVPSGSTATIGGYEVANGESTLHSGTIECTDEPKSWTDGFVVPAS